VVRGSGSSPCRTSLLLGGQGGARGEESCKHMRRTMVAQEVGSSVPGPVKSYSVHGTRVPEHYL
jgi:hypothetical protein